MQLLTGETRTINLFGNWDYFTQVSSGISNGERMSYLDGVIAIQYLSSLHRNCSQMAGLLISHYLAMAGVNFSTGNGTALIQDQVVFVQPDQQFTFGDNEISPQLAIDIRMGELPLNKMTHYFTLRIPEVWIRQEGGFKVYTLFSDGYRRAETTAIEPLKKMSLSLLSTAVSLANSEPLQAIDLFNHAHLLNRSQTA